MPLHNGIRDMDYEAVSLSLQMAMMVIALAMLFTVLERS